MDRYLEPLKLGSVLLKNRIVMTPMGLYGLPTPDGALTDRGIEFYVERARGGTGLIFPAAALVSTEFEGPCSAIYAMDSLDRSVGWSELAERVHHYGAALGIQLSAGLGRINVDYFFDEAHVPVSASEVPAFWTPWITCRALEVKEIARLVTAFGRAAALARTAGVDVIEIHGYGGYLLDQFMSTLWNRRADGYGGDLDGRMRFAVEALTATREACGDDVPVIFKMTPVHRTEGGRELPEGLEIAKRLEKAGADAIHVDVGCYESWHTAIPPVYAPDAAQIDTALEVKRAVSVPVLSHGKLGDPSVAESVLEEGKADLVGLGRPLLADPFWVSKVAGGRSEEIVACIGCNDGCIGRGFEGKYASCSVNPRCAMETKYMVGPAAVAKKVIVVGGGPAGMEAASLCAERGHHVILFEKSGALGGCLLAASAPSFKSDLRRFLRYYEGRVMASGALIRPGREATAADVLGEQPDAVIVAQGGSPARPALEGIDTVDVPSAEQVLTGAAECGHRVVVLGGGVVGCETALFLAGDGHEVTIVETEGSLVWRGAFLLNRQGLLEMIEGSGIDVMLGATARSVEPGRLSVESPDGLAQVGFDTAVAACGSAPSRELHEELYGKVDELNLVGDAAQPRNVLHAVWEGFHAARLL